MMRESGRSNQMHFYQLMSLQIPALSQTSGHCMYLINIIVYNLVMNFKVLTEWHSAHLAAEEQ
jgi:hypothetical protein